MLVPRNRKFHHAAVERHAKEGEHQRQQEQHRRRRHRRIPHEGEDQREQRRLGELLSREEKDLAAPRGSGGGGRRRLHLPGTSPRGLRADLEVGKEPDRGLGRRRREGALLQLPGGEGRGEPGQFLAGGQR